MVDAAQIAGLNCLRLMNETTAGLYTVFLAQDSGKDVHVCDCCTACGCHPDYH